MGKIVSICNNKGGVGKTTSNIHLASALNERGYKCLRIDLEYPGYFSAFSIPDFNPFTGDDDRVMRLFRDDSDVEPVVVSDKLHVFPSLDLLSSVDQFNYDAIYAFRSNVHKLSENYDFVIIDSPPLLNLRLDCILAAADNIFVVIEPVPYSFGGLVSFNNQYNKIRSRINPSLPELPIIFFNKYSGIAKYRHAQSVKEFHDAYPNDHILPHMLKLRSPIVDAVDDGVPAWNYMSAKKDVRDEFSNVFFSMVDILESDKWSTT